MGPGPGAGLLRLCWPSDDGGVGGRWTKVFQICDGEWNDGRPFFTLSPRPPEKAELPTSSLSLPFPTTLVKRPAGAKKNLFRGSLACGDRLIPLLHQGRHQCRHHQQIQEGHQATQSGEHSQPHLGLEKEAQQQQNGEFQLQQKRLIHQTEQGSHHGAKWMEFHSGKMGRGLGLLLRCKTGVPSPVTPLQRATASHRCNPWRVDRSVARGLCCPCRLCATGWVLC